MAKHTQQYSARDKFLWLTAFLLFACGIFGYYHFAHAMLLFRVIGVLVVFTVALICALKTNKGNAAILAWHNAYAELRKIVWPTKQETIQATLAVFAMVVVMSVLLWSLDLVLVRVLKWLTS